MLWPDSTGATCGRRSRSTPQRDRRYGGAVDPPDGVAARSLVCATGGQRRWSARAQSAQVPKISRVWLTSVKPCSRGDLVGPPLDGRALDLDGRGRSARHTRWWWWPCRAARGRPPRRRRCAARRPRRRRPSPAASGRRWRGRPAPRRREELVDLLGGAEVVDVAERGRDRLALPGGAATCVRAGGFLASDISVAPGAVGRRGRCSGRHRRRARRSGPRGQRGRWPSWTKSTWSPRGTASCPQSTPCSCWCPSARRCWCVYSELIARDLPGLSWPARQPRGDARVMPGAGGTAS